MSPLQVHGAQQEGRGDLAACEDERLSEEGDPVGGRGGMVFVEPIAKRAEGANAFGVLDRGVDLQPVAYDAVVVAGRVSRR